VSSKPVFVPDSCFLEETFFPEWRTAIFRRSAFDLINDVLFARGPFSLAARLQLDRL
jgi:hypothetical protein